MLEFGKLEDVNLLIIFFLLYKKWRVDTDAARITRHRDGNSEYIIVVARLSLSFIQIHPTYRYIVYAHHTLYTTMYYASILYPLVYV